MRVIIEREIAPLSAVGPSALVDDSYLRMYIKARLFITRYYHI